MRSEGLDVARALAILGMFVVHAGLVLAPGDPHPIFDLCDGRAAATFLVIAGIATARATLADRELRRRGALLLALGFVNLLVWPGDILRVYGVALLLAPWLRRGSPRVLLAITVGLFVAFVPLLLFADWDARWRWEDLHYRGLWTPVGLVRNLTFDGFRALVPWLGLYTLGLALGRADDARLARLTVPGAALALGAAILSMILVERLGGGEEVVAVFGTGSMPPMPLFLATAVGTALFLIGAAMGIASPALARTGRLAGTWYLGHIALLVALAIANVQTTAPVALAGALAAFAAAVAISRRVQRGPFERLLRRRR
jgi:uncharacterized membrane protein YeiB